jgi:energy-converting hydrogenase Eha subunit A
MLKTDRIHQLHQIKHTNKFLASRVLTIPSVRKSKICCSFTKHLIFPSPQLHALGVLVSTAVLMVVGGGGGTV